MSADGATASAEPSAGETVAVDSTQSSSDAALEKLAALPEAVQLPAGRWQPGTHYLPLVPTQPTSVTADKVEVVEVFWYGCNHCFALETPLTKWLQQKPSYVELQRMPAIWTATQRAHARLYYTLQAMGRIDALHARIFNAVQVRKQPLAGRDDAESLRLQSAFVADHDIDVQEFQKTWASFGVQARLQFADEMLRRYRLGGVPALIINGKYVTDAVMAGGYAEAIAAAHDLAASEKRR